MRLFVGGIENTITEEELKQRFEPFGKVTSVHRVAKKDETGLVGKVFAYIDIDISDVNLKKCISVYNKAKWKGCQLKIQPAREDFLARLQKEREATKEVKASQQRTTLCAGPRENEAFTITSKTKGDSVIASAGSETSSGEMIRPTTKMALASHGNEKRILSNQKRLEALKLKMSFKSALTWSSATLQHITFNSSEDEETPITPRGDTEKQEDASTISKKLLFHSDDEELPPVIETRYEGQTGHRLFTLQQQIGHDVRFQVSEKFLDSNDKSYKEEESVSNDKGQTDSSTQLQHEKSQALNILNSMFGEVSNTSFTQEHAPPSLNDTGLYCHYDPFVQGHAALEKGTTSKQCKVEALPSPCSSPLQTSEQVPVQQAEIPQNCLKRFFSVTPNLKSLFGSGEGGHAPFTFLHTEDKDGIIDGPSEQPILNVVKSKKLLGKQFVEPAELQVKTEIASTARFCLFFHSNNPNLSNRLSENSFYRSHVLDEIEQEWKAKKPKLKECCRQRWKDAIKRTKRLRSRGNQGRT